MASLKLTILSPERRLAEGLLIDEVTLCGSEGQIQILPGHAAMVGTLEDGEISYKPSGAPRAKGVISAGFFEVRDDLVSVLAEALEIQDGNW
ncbi:hypothetical protein WDW37_10135 [Bdellovibrionota bacterium FG-1]